MSPDLEKSRQMMLDTDMCLMFNSNKPFADCMKENGRRRKACNSMNEGGEFLYAAKHNCCAWRGHHKLEVDGVFTKENKQGYCGMDHETYMDATEWAVYQIKRGNSGRTSCFDDNPREFCCVDESIDSFGDCDHFSSPSGPSKREADNLAVSNDYFY